MIPEVPAIRVVEGEPQSGRYVLYWMIAQRRPGWNFALQRALWWGQELGLPVAVFEPLRIGYPWASDRFHTYVMQGMRDNAVAFDNAGLTYRPYVEREAGEGSGYLEALAADAAVVVTDEYPAFFLPRMVAAAKEGIPHLETVDSNGLMPLRSSPKPYKRAVDFRRFLQKNAVEHLQAFPLADPLAEYDGGLVDLPGGWPTEIPDCADLDIDHEVGRVDEVGGHVAGSEQLSAFLVRLEDYLGRNHPDDDGASRLSAYLHFGHVGAHQVLDALLHQEGFSIDGLAEKTRGQREGWWGLSEAAESYIDEVITWREVGYHFCHHVPDYDQYETLPEWARTSLAAHASDEREYVYDLATLDAAATHDDIWNAAQRQLKVEGRIHNYLRMLWGKKVLQWSQTPQDAVKKLIELNNRYAIDGRDPNSYSGIFWCFGRFDRAWGPERPIFGKVRYMTSQSTRRKLRLKSYLERWSS